MLPFALLFIFAITINAGLSSAKEKKIFLALVIFIGLWLISTFRSTTFGPDTEGYLLKYNSLFVTNFIDQWRTAFTPEEKDPFFYLLAKLIHSTGASDRAWLSMLSGFFLTAFILTSYRYSTDVVISAIMLISLGFLFFSFTGLRQTLALSFILFSTKYLIDKKPTKFALTIIIASLFHSTAIIFIISYYIRNNNTSKFYYLYIMSFIILASIFEEEIKSIILFSGIKSIEAYGESEIKLNYSGLIIQILTFAFILKYKEKLLNLDANNLVFINIIFIGVLFQVLASTIAEFFRISMYFNIYCCFLIPTIIKKCISRNWRHYAYYFAILLLVTYMYISNKYVDFSLS